jgi:DNA-binding NtrC family response regulator
MANKENRATVLVVDDERGPRESLRMLLAPNHEVLSSSSGVNALEILRTEKVDVVTLDLNMPGIGGEELMRTIREEHPHVEIIVITGCGSLASAQEGIRHGICDYLQKPFDVVQVTAAVNRALTRGSARRGLVRFMEDLGDAVGRDRDTRRILLDIRRSQKMRGSLGNLFDRQGTSSWRSSSTIPVAPSNSSRCWRKRSSSTTAACAATRGASHSTRR